MTNLQAQQIENQSEIIKEEIQETLLSTASIIEKVYEVVAERKTFGKSVDEWHNNLTIRLDPQADPAKVKLYLASLSNNLDIAQRNFSKIKLMYGQYKLSYRPLMASQVAGQANHKGRKVAPSIETMSLVAENSLGDRSTAAIEFETFIDFWQDMVYKVRNQIDVVKTIAMSNGTLYKVGEYSLT